MKKKSHSLLTAFTIILGGCVPANTNYITYVNISQDSFGVFCESTQVMQLKELKLLPLPVIKETASDEEVVDQLIDHIDDLREQVKELVEADYRCRIVR